MAAKIESSGVYSPSEDVVARDIHGEFIIIPITSGASGTEDAIFSLNKIGKAVWDRLDGKRSLKEIAVALGSEFDGSTREIEKDVIGFAEELYKRKMLVKAK